MKNSKWNDWAIALIVIACSGALLAALALALTGTTLGKPSRTLRVRFQDVTGVNAGAQVKYAGALAGKVLTVRMLTPQERMADGQALNAVELVLALNAAVPTLPDDIQVSIAADTLLSDKLVLLEGGSPNAGTLPNDAILQGITPVSFDKLTREVDRTIAGLGGLFQGAEGETRDLFGEFRALLGQVEALVADSKQIIAQARPVVDDAGLLVGDARRLVTENREPISRTFAGLEKAGAALEELAGKGSRMVSSNEKKLGDTVSDFRVTAENLKVTSTYLKILVRNLSLRPSQLLWGTSKPPALPSEARILRDRKPVPAD